MRIGIVRSDIAHMYLADVENRSQRCFSSQPAGQSRYLHKPRDVEFLAFLNRVGYLTLTATDANAAVNTVGNNVLRIRVGATSAYTVITVYSHAAATKVRIASDINIAFVNAGLPFIASVDSTNHIHIDTTGTNKGPTARIQIDSVANGSTLNSIIGYAAGGVSATGLAVATLKTAVYPTAVTIDVSSATTLALSTFAAQTTAQKVATALAIADFVAPKLIETGPALLSFAYGEMSKMRSATFRPGGARVGLPAGIAAAIVQDDGTTPFTI